MFLKHTSLEIVEPIVLRFAVKKKRESLGDPGRWRRRPNAAVHLGLGGSLLPETGAYLEKPRSTLPGPRSKAASAVAGGPFARGGSSDPGAVFDDVSVAATSSLPVVQCHKSGEQFPLSVETIGDKVGSDPTGPHHIDPI